MQGVVGSGLRVSRMRRSHDSGVSDRTGHRRRAVNLLPAITKLGLSRLRWVFATGDQRDAEILALRHQFLVPQCQIECAQFTDTDRTILAMLSGVFDRRRKIRTGATGGPRRTDTTWTADRRVNRVENPPSSRHQPDPRSHRIDVDRDHPLPSHRQHYDRLRLRRHRGLDQSAPADAADGFSALTPFIMTCTANRSTVAVKSTFMISVHHE